MDMISYKCTSVLANVIQSFFLNFKKAHKSTLYPGGLKKKLFPTRVFLNESFSKQIRLKMLEISRYPALSLCQKNMRSVFLPNLNSFSALCLLIVSRNNRHPFPSNALQPKNCYRFTTRPGKNFELVRKQAPYACEKYHPIADFTLDQSKRPNR